MFLCHSAVTGCADSAMFVGSQRHLLSIAKMLMVIFLPTCGLVWSHQVNQYCERDSDHCSELLRLEDPHGYLDKHFKCKYPEVAECQQMAAFYDTGPEYQRYEHVTYFEPDDVSIYQCSLNLLSCYGLFRILSLCTRCCE